MLLGSILLVLTSLTSIGFYYLGTVYSVYMLGGLGLFFSIVALAVGMTMWELLSPSHSSS